MAYYNRNGIPLNLKTADMEYLTSGKCTTVKHNNKIIL